MLRCCTRGKSDTNTTGNRGSAGGSGATASRDAGGYSKIGGGGTGKSKTNDVGHSKPMTDDGGHDAALQQPYQPPPLH